MMMKFARFLVDPIPQAPTCIRGIHWLLITFCCTHEIWSGFRALLSLAQADMLGAHEHAMLFLMMLPIFPMLAATFWGIVSLHQVMARLSARTIDSTVDVAAKKVTRIVETPAGRRQCDRMIARRNSLHPRVVPESERGVTAKVLETALDILCRASMLAAAILTLVGIWLQLWLVEWIWLTAATSVVSLIVYMLLPVRISRR